MRTTFALLPLSLALLAPTAALAQQAAPAPSAAPDFSGLFTAWSGTSRESLRAETEQRRAPPAGAVPAGSPLVARGHEEAVALGERVAEFVRRGDCAQGERIAREAGDFPLVRAVRDHCRTNS